MEDIICGISAFRLYRTPPQLLLAMPELPLSRDRSTRTFLTKNPAVQHLIGAPLHLLTQSRNAATGAKNIKHHLWSGVLPPQAIVEVPCFRQTTSPLFTLFLLTRDLSEVQLTMAMYELCGDFTVYRPSSLAEQMLSEAATNALGLDQPHWQRVVDAQGRATNLWRRPPLVEVEQLKSFAEQTAGLRGHKKFLAAARHVTGIASSPFEAQASMLLGMPRRLGGLGIGDIENNKAIKLTRQARIIAGRSTCYADLYLENADGSKSIDIECQGAAVHDGGHAAASDADRTTALESMGVDVILLSYNQLVEQGRFNAVAQHIARALGKKLAPKNAKLQRAESELRRELFIDWAMLGGSTPEAS